MIRSADPTPVRLRRSAGTAARSERREVRNPILALPADRRLLADLLEDLARDAGQRAQTCWCRHKAPMAAYWKACSVYARHMARVVRPAGPGTRHVAR